MRKKLIAAFAFTAVVCGNAPVALATSSASQKSAQHSPSETQHHPCCPGFHVQMAALLFVMIPPADMPCGDQRPCCAKQGPQNPPAVTPTTKGKRPRSEGVLTAAAEQGLNRPRCIAVQIAGRDYLPSYFVRSTVLRI
jgi:hypothetical protein